MNNDLGERVIQIDYEKIMSKLKGTKLYGIEYDEKDIQHVVVGAFLLGYNHYIGIVNQKEENFYE